MYYSSGNLEAFARPEKPEGVACKSAYIIGAGLAGLAAACFLVRDAQMAGERIHIFEKTAVPGGACHGGFEENPGYVLGGARETDSHYECLWDLLRSVPSLETPGISVLDDCYRLSKHDPNSSLVRATVRRGQDARTGGKFAISDKGVMEILELYMTPDEALCDKRIGDVFDEEVFRSEFWTIWRTMYAFKSWHSALEMKRYIKRIIHRVEGLGDFSALRFPRYNSYDALIRPLIAYLQTAHVSFRYNTHVVNVEFDSRPGKKVAKSLVVMSNGAENCLSLTEDDLVFFTNGGCTENCGLGDQNHPAPFNQDITSGGGWDLWRKIASRDSSFGRPDKFCQSTDQTAIMSATVTTLDCRIPPYIQKVCKRDPFSGKVVTGGLITATDSAWLLSWSFNRQPQFPDQPEGQLVGWIFGLFNNKAGDYVKKPMRQCTGKEICMEWLYHLGVPECEIEDMAANSANTVPCMLPYLTAFFMPRRPGDRPDIVPKGSANFAFIGQFAETERDTAFSSEYSVRTAMEAVYTLLAIDRGVPEVWGGEYDLRELINAVVLLRDGKKITTMELGFKERIAQREILKRIADTDIERLLKDRGAI